MNGFRLKKSVLSLVVAVCCLSSVFSLPAVKPFIPDISGEFIYFKDYSFQNESIIGFLYYNESTYAVRFYSPANAGKKILEKDICLYISVNPQSKNLDMTGEKIVGAGAKEDTEIINYMHDLFYELTARRQKIGNLGESPLISKEDYVQFGGNVKIRYNSYVPIFNIETISSASGKPLLETQTCGFLSNSTDTSFTAFKGVNGLPKDKKRDFKKNKVTPVKVGIDGQSIQIDSGWKTAMDNMWFLGDYAFLSMSSLPAVPEKSNNLQLLTRKLTEGTTRTYSIWPQHKVESDSQKIKIMNVFLQPEIENVTRDFKILTRKKDGTYAFVTLTVYDSVYQKNRSYFDAILKSYSAE